MAGASTTMTVVSNILKEVYEDKLRDQLQSEVLTLQRIEKSTEGVTSEVGGKYVVFPIRTRRNHGIGARNENEALPNPKSQKYASARVQLAYLYGAASITGQTMELADKNFQAFASALQQELDGLRQTLAKDMNRQVYGTSTGVLGTVTADGANTVTVALTDMQYLELGMQIDVYDVTGVTPKFVNREITAINTATGVITYDGADGTAVATDIIVRAGSVNRETIGFKQIVNNSGTLYNIDSAVEPVWKSVVDSNAGAARALSEGLMIKMIDNIRTNGGRTTVIFTTLGVRRAYFNLLSQQRRFQSGGGAIDFAGGFKGLAFTTDWGDVPVMSDFDCQPQRMYFINEKELKLYQEADWKFMNRDGSNWQRIIDSSGTYDAYQCMMYSYRQLGTHRRNSHGLLSDVQEAS
jgi:hypothetical protein